MHQSRRLGSLGSAIKRLDRHVAQRNRDTIQPRHGVKRFGMSEDVRGRIEHRVEIQRDELLLHSAGCHRRDG